jgi:hypothetical protein
LNAIVETKVTSDYKDSNIIKKGEFKLWEQIKGPVYGLDIKFNQKDPEIKIEGRVEKKKTVKLNKSGEKIFASQGFVLQFRNDTSKYAEFVALSIKPSKTTAGTFDQEWIFSKLDGTVVGT